MVLNKVAGSDLKDRPVTERPTSTAVCLNEVFLNKTMSHYLLTHYTVHILNIIKDKYIL